MEVLGAVTTVWTVVQGAKEIGGLVMQVKAALNQVHQNRKEHADKIQQMLELLDEIGAACKDIKSDRPGLSDPARKLQLNLKRLLQCCQDTTGSRGWLKDFWKRDTIKKSLEDVKESITYFLVRYSAISNMRIEKTTSDNSDKLDRLLSLERYGSGPSDFRNLNSKKQSTTPSRNTREYLSNQLQKLSILLEAKPPQSHLISLPVYPEPLASNTHRPLLSDAANDLRDAITRTRLILETYNTDSAADTAHSLDDLSVALMDVGLADQASEISSVSVRIYGNIPTLECDSNFAVALRNHSNHLKALGKVDEAIEQARHAVDIYDNLRDDIFDPGRAGAYDSLAACLYALGKYEKALIASNSAVHVARDLLRRKPRDKRLSADLAMFLSNRANTLHSLNRHEDALKDASESQKKYHTLQSLSERYTEEYADSLGIYSRMLFTLRRYGEALLPAREAAGLWGQLHQQRPDVYSPKLARALLSLFDLLRILNRPLEAEDEICRAVKLFRGLAAQSPGIFKPEYARSLHGTGRVLMDLQRFPDSLAFLDEARSIYSLLPLKEWGAELAAVYQDKHHCMTRLKRYSAAVDASRSAIDILKQTSPSRHNNDELAALHRDLASALFNVSIERDKLPDVAVEPALEAVRLFRVLLGEKPQDTAVRRRLVAASTSLSMFYSDLSRHEEALKYAKLSVKEGSSMEDKAALRKAWIRLSRCYRNKGDEKRAVEAEDIANRLE
ncbi:hypothetical protein B0H19DRAFT_1267483 [Mycena capillaripes]|nr:hypothetical protein B0H19DRAFT_1267483 [Mycena capillaripes]